MDPKRIDIIGGLRKCYGIFKLLEFKMIDTTILHGLCVPW